MTSSPPLCPSPDPLRSLGQTNFLKEIRYLIQPMKHSDFLPQAFDSFALDPLQPGEPADLGFKLHENDLPIGNKNYPVRHTVVAW